jgi:hypothetical protein
LSTPGFTAEASLGAPSEHYRTARRASHLPTHVASPIHPALAVGEETINVVGCPPGYLQIGQGENITCVLPPQPGGSIPGPEPLPGEGEPLETGPRRPPGKKKQETKKPPKPPRSPFSRFTPHKGNPCHAREFPLDDPQNSVIIFAGSYLPPSKPGQPWACCGANRLDQGNPACVGCQRSGDITQCAPGDVSCLEQMSCHNGWPCGPSGMLCPPSK